MATKVSICADGRKFEWRNGELFIVSPYVHGDTVWIDAGLMERIRNAAPPEITSDEFPVYVIIRTDEGDRVMKVEQPVTFAGGDVLCFVRPLTTH